MSLVKEVQALSKEQKNRDSKDKNLEVALERYHKMIVDGVITPRGFNLMTPQENLQNLQRYLITSPSNDRAQVSVDHSFSNAPK